MSILLEALRKSEKNQHTRAAPTIHTDDQPDPVSEPLPTGWLALMLVITLFVSGWFVWRQYRLPAESFQAPVAETTVKADVDSTPVQAEKRGIRAEPSNPSTTVSSAQSRTPVESYDPPEPVEQGPAGEAATTRTDDAQTLSERVVTTAQREPEPEAVVAEKSPGTAAEEYHPGEPQPIGYWDLPDSVRANVPEIKFSVLVYATNPADRFVLINGQRLGEGSSAQPGLVVKEIRRDGVLFSYRLYQFLVER